MQIERSDPAARTDRRKRAADRAVVRSGGSVAVVVLFSWLAASAGSEPPAAFDPRAGYVSEAPALISPSAEHRRQVFDERRARFDDAHPARNARVATNAGD